LELANLFPALFFSSINAGGTLRTERALSILSIASESFSSGISAYYSSSEKKIS